MREAGPGALPELGEDGGRPVPGGECVQARLPRIGAVRLGAGGDGRQPGQGVEVTEHAPGLQ
ncbi:hypothetical protein VM98_37530, partial [Streptomyces rubellomurinus subsp. indigoferus]